MNKKPSSEPWGKKTHENLPEKKHTYTVYNIHIYIYISYMILHHTIKPLWCHQHCINHFITPTHLLSAAVSSASSPELRASEGSWENFKILRKKYK
jgi:hypothetical protein